MNPVLWIHIAAGIAALPLGVIAVSARKGGRVHKRTGAWFAVSMLVLGITAALLEPYRSPPGSPVGGIMVCYFVATGYAAGRRRNERIGRFEIIAGAFALALAGALTWGGFTGSTTPAGPGPVVVLGVLCLLAAVGDVRAALPGKLSAAQRLSRHLWRMCFAFFIATGSFFLGQQQVMPEILRGSPILFGLAFAPLAILLFWLVRIRFAKTVGKLTQRGTTALPAIPPIATLERKS